MERLCIEMSCTPNDFYEWTPDANKEIAKDQSHKNERVINITKSINNISYENLKIIEKVIAELNNTKG